MRFLDRMKYQIAAATMMTSRMIHHQLAALPVVPSGAGVLGAVVCASADDMIRTVRAIQEAWRIFPPRVIPDAMIPPAVKLAHAAPGPESFRLRRLIPEAASAGERVQRNPKSSAPQKRTASRATEID